MAEVINLRRARKNLARVEDEKQAEANRIKFGRSKAEKNLAKAEDKNATKFLDDHKIEE